MTSTHRESANIKPGDMVECRKYGQLIIQLVILSMDKSQVTIDDDKVMSYVQYAAKTCNIRQGDEFIFTRNYFDFWNKDNNGCEWEVHSV